MGGFKEHTVPGIYFVGVRYQMSGGGTLQYTF